MYYTPSSLVGRRWEQKTAKRKKQTSERFMGMSYREETDRNGYSLIGVGITPNVLSNGLYLDR
jgi:hypothetical protein